jgi:hypothetical protein
METGKVEYAPDYKSRESSAASHGARLRTLIRNSTAKDPIRDLASTDSAEKARITTEHERLRAAVVEKSKAAQRSLASITFLNVDVGTFIRELIAANSALIAFEADHEIGEG